MRLLVRGCIFDSCPCYMHKYAGANALAHGFPPAWRPLIRGLFSLLVLVSFALHGDYASKFWCAVRPPAASLRRAPASGSCAVVAGACAGSGAGAGPP
jgi:hypothetical protein